MSSTTLRRHTVWMALLVIGVFTIAEVEARGGGRSFSRSGAAGSGSFGGNFSSRTSSYSRSGAASSGSWQANRSQMQQSRQSSTGQRQSSRQSHQSDMQSQISGDRSQSREDRQQYGTDKQQSRQDYGNQTREDRQDYQKDAREDWQDYGDDYHRGGYYHGGHHYSDDGFLAGMVIGATITAVAFSAQKASCTTLVVNGMSYYQCGSTWYQPSYQGGSVTYIVVNSPQ